MAKINKNKSWFFEKISTINKYLAYIKCVSQGTKTISVIWRFNRKDYLVVGYKLLREVKRTLTSTGTAPSWEKSPKEEGALEEGPPARMRLTPQGDGVAMAHSCQRNLLRGHTSAKVGKQETSPWSARETQEEADCGVLWISLNSHHHDSLSGVHHQASLRLLEAVSHRSKTKKTLEPGRKGPSSCSAPQGSLLTKFNAVPVTKESYEHGAALVSQSKDEEGQEIQSTNNWHAWTIIWQ